MHSDLWNQIFERLVSRFDQQGKTDRSIWCIDGSVIRAHRSASGRLPQSEENDELAALGRSRGGYSTKLHVITDRKGTLLAITATGGQQHESIEFENLLNRLPLNIHQRHKHPEAIAGDRGCSSTLIQTSLAKLGIRAIIPTRSNEMRHQAFDKQIYRQRNIVELVIGWLKESRRVATRYDRLVASYLAFVQLAAVRRMLKCI